MGVHPSGDGDTWSLVEAVDVDQPHGKDYLYSQHIAKGVRKRIEYEHADFADATVGGIHTPGGCAILGIEDGTATIVADGTLKGHGLVWDNTAAIWCATAAAGASTTGDWTLVRINPNTQWAGGDVTWAGEHHFDASVDFDCTAVVFNGDVSIVEHLACGSSVEVASDFSVEGNANFGGDVSFDSTAVFGGDISVDGNVQIDGSLTLNEDVAGLWKHDGASIIINDTFITGEWSSYDSSAGGRTIVLLEFKLTDTTATTVVMMAQPKGHTDVTGFHTSLTKSINYAKPYEISLPTLLMTETDANGEFDIIGDPTNIAVTLTQIGTLGIEK